MSHGDTCGIFELFPKDPLDPLICLTVNGRGSLWEVRREKSDEKIRIMNNEWNS